MAPRSYTHNLSFSHTFQLWLKCGSVMLSKHSVKILVVYPNHHAHPEGALFVTAMLKLVELDKFKGR